MLKLPDGTATKDLVVGLIPQSDTIYAVVLAASTSQQIAIPAGANKVLFSVNAGIDFYMLFANAAISVPVGNITDGTAPELNPLLRICSGKSFVSLIAASNCVITMAFYQ